MRLPALLLLLTACPKPTPPTPPPSEPVTAAELGELLTDDEKAEDENEPPVEETGPPEDGPTVYGEELDAGEFRAGTFNAHLLGVEKARAPFAGNGAGFSGLENWRAIIRMMDEGNVHVLGVQEVYLTSLIYERQRADGRFEPVPGRTYKTEQRNQHPLLKPEPAGRFKILPGPVVYTYGFRRKLGVAPITQLVFQRTEFCPVIFDSDRLDCRAGGRQSIGGGKTALTPRHAHYVSCTFTRGGKNIAFQFKCAHFAANDEKAKENIASLGAIITDDAKSIVAADFNSYIYGALKTFYASVSSLKHFLQPDPVSLAKQKGVLAPYTKLHLVGGKAQENKDPASKILDDLLWSLKMDEHFEPGSKTTLPFAKLGFDAPMTRDDYTRDFSDHLPVVADFR